MTREYNEHDILDAEFAARLLPPLAFQPFDDDNIPSNEYINSLIVAMQKVEKQLDADSSGIPHEVIHTAVEANFYQRAAEASASIAAFHAHKVNSPYIQRLWGMHEFCTPDIAFAFFREHAMLPSLDVAAFTSDDDNRHMATQMIQRMNSHFLTIAPVYNEDPTVTIDHVGELDGEVYGVLSVQKLIATDERRDVELKRRKTYAVPLSGLDDPSLASTLDALNQKTIDNRTAENVFAAALKETTPEAFVHIIESLYITRPKVVEDYRKAAQRKALAGHVLHTQSA